MIEFKNIEIRYGDFVAIKDLNLTIGKEVYIGFKAMSVATLKL